ncbi:glycoside hydrolase family 43 protein [Alkalicoccobacillus porphyridii]|uniref:Family 43 glycosylhydrolase n=1 Tax=Alkalicoccobacillus porphyridii TaxID=2597270 RepID=A0A554A2F3_9BACI|nr:glycoside hydrolase family 43 protein [Alkalicoccobacillus porphyridii]TSB47870.1 family 43 glycosylhydrolase [Alkalicoccobacillus porphyridii]
MKSEDILREELDPAREVDTSKLKEPIVKEPPHGNPLLSHRFGADPYAIVFKDRVYIYSTNDTLKYDDEGNVIDNNYGHIHSITVASSQDLVNWTDHGAIQVAGEEGAAPWATQSWAPAAAHKVIDGKDKFFLYFSNNASGIGVLTSDSPIGPWKDPIKQPLISRDTPGVKGVTWLFDPAVLVDDDGKGYIYFGGGIPEGEYEMPNTARVMELDKDMISVVGEAEPIQAPFMFEDAGINKVGSKYYYSYCSNFYNGERPVGSPGAGEIAYMISDHPKGPWTYQSTILKNPAQFFQVGGNNHHAMFRFKERWYIAYHAQTLSKAMGVPKGYRSTHLNRIFFNDDGTIQEVHADYQGVKKVSNLDPYQPVNAVTYAWQAGIQVSECTVYYNRFVVGSITKGSWIGLSSVDFEAGATQFEAVVSSEKEGGMIEIRLDHQMGETIGWIDIPNTGGKTLYKSISRTVKRITGVHDVYFIFGGVDDQDLFTFLSWQFR